MSYGFVTITRHETRLRFVFFSWPDHGPRKYIWEFAAETDCLSSIPGIFSRTRAMQTTDRRMHGTTVPFALRPRKPIKDPTILCPNVCHFFYLVQMFKSANHHRSVFAKQTNRSSPWYLLTQDPHIASLRHPTPTEMQNLQPWKTAETASRKQPLSQQTWIKVTSVQNKSPPSKGKGYTTTIHICL